MSRESQAPRVSLFRSKSNRGGGGGEEVYIQPFPFCVLLHRHMAGALLEVAVIMSHP
jgi:hypothetical protein